MRSSRTLWFLLALLAAGMSAKPVHAQDDANFEIGLKPYGSYHMGKIDNVSLGNGSLGVDIPLISYPQRGGKLALDFALHYFNGSSYQVQACYSSQFGTECVWEPFGTYGGLAIIDTQAFMYGVLFGEDTPVCSSTGQEYLDYCNFQVSDTDGTSHLLQPINAASTSYRTVDATGILGSGPTNSTLITSLTDTQGIVHTNVQYGVPADTRVDSNGNEIGYSSTAGWTDTMGRTIPVIPTPSSSGVSNCPQPPNVPLAPASASVWSPPGPNSGTYTMTLCYATFSYTHPYSGSTSVLQSVVLPDGTAWNFTYLQSLGSYIPIADLSEIAYPTGGTISYTWTGTAVCYPGNNVNEAVATRTLNPDDGVTPASEWTYTFASTGTTVTDPASNASVHVFGVGGPPGTQNGCFLYENQAKYYQGSTSGTLLKTVNTSYSYIPLTGAYNYTTQLGPIGDVVPIEVDTLWPNGQESTVKHSYDSGIATYYPYYGGSQSDVLETGGSQYTAIYGKELTRSEYDYGNGGPGSLLRTTTTSYLALNNSSYLTANLLDLPSSVQVTGSGPGSYTTYGYDESGSPQGTHGNLTSVHRWLNTTGGYLVTNNIYNSNGLLTSSTDPKLNPTTYGYSGSYAGSGPTSVTNALGQTTNYAYDFNTGLLTSATDPNSLTTSDAYDNMLRTRQVNYPDGGQSTFGYPTPNEVDISEKIGSSGPDKTSSLLVDGVGREIRRIVSNGESPQYDQVDTCYDGLGRVSFKGYPYQGSGLSMSRACSGAGDSFAYDALTRTLSVSHSDANSVISTSYSGNSTTVTDEQGKTRESFVDGLGRPTQVIEDPGSGLHLKYNTTYAYDVLGNLTSVVQNGSRNRTFAYDSLSRLTSSTNPESNWSPTSQTNVSTTYAYDADGNLINKTEPAQNQQSTATVTLTYCYDALNRITAKGYTAQTCTGGTTPTMPTPVATYAYDGNAPSGCSVGSFSFGLAIGKRTAMCDAAGSEAWAYNILPGVGWRTTDQRTTNSITKTSVYQGDLLGSPLSVQYPSGRTINYTPNAADRPTSATDAGSGLNYASNAHYAANGTQCWAVLGGVTTVSETFNSRLQPNQMQATNSVDGYSGSCPGLGQTGNLLDLSYNFNLGSGDDGNVMGIVNNRDTTRSQAFMYDALNRLSQATASTYAVSPAHCWGESYQYDNQSIGGAWGNLTSISLPSSSYNQCNPTESLSLTLDPNNNNRISPSDGYSYDTAGNLTSVSGPAGGSYSFNPENQMTQSITDFARTGYVYDGDGKRVEKTTSGTPYQLYWYDLSGNVLGETDATGSNFNEYIFFGGKRIARLTPVPSY